jgi:hypothetical protein
MFSRQTVHKTVTLSSIAFGLVSAVLANYECDDSGHTLTWALFGFGGAFTAGLGLFLLFSIDDWNTYDNR